MGKPASLNLNEPLPKDGISRTLAVSQVATPQDMVLRESSFSSIGGVFFIARLAAWQKFFGKAGIATLGSGLWNGRSFWKVLKSSNATIYRLGNIIRKVRRYLNYRECPRAQESLEIGPGPTIPEVEYCLSGWTDFGVIL